MTDHAAEVRHSLTDPWSLCDSLGLTAKAKRSGTSVSIRCPSHQDSNPSCSVRLGPDGTIQVKCHGCDFAGDALHLIAKANGLDCDDKDGFREVLVIGAEIAGDLMLADEIRTGKRNADRAPVPVPPREPDRDYPPQAEVVDVWSMAHPVGSAPAAKALLESRAIDPASLARLDLARVLPPGCPLPAWGSYGGRPWSSSGHRMICRVVDHLGTVRSIRAWQVDGIDSPKRLPPSGHKAAGLVLANRAAAALFAGKGTSKRMVVCEGEPDWLTWCTRVDATVAVIGVGSGSWTADFANRLPKGCQVIIRTHVDLQGDKYAAHVADTIGERCSVWRLTVDKTGLWLDENDKAKNGTLPTDPETGCSPVNEAAQVELANRPRVFTVRELLSQAHSRVISQEPIRVLTTGHWKVDMMTGGIRPGFTWVFGADTSWGKSAWALMLADENLKKGFRVLIVSTEDDEDIYGDRLLARRSGVDATRIRDRKCDAADHKRITEVVNKGEPLPVYLDARGKNFEKVIHEIKSLVDGEGIDLTVLDYIGECRLKKKTQDERLMFKEIAQMFRYGVKEQKRSGIINSQLTIDDPSKPPTRKNIRECRDIGSGAEGIMLGWKPPADVRGKDPETGQEVIKYKADARVMLVDKAKGGKCGSVELDWNDKTASFKRTMRPCNAGPETYELSGFERTELDDIEQQFQDGF